VIMTDGFGTLCTQRMIVMMFVGMNVTPDNLLYNTSFRSAKSCKTLLSISLLWETRYRRDRSGYPPRL
jgi:hypothetical protein